MRLFLIISNLCAHQDTQHLISVNKQKHSTTLDFLEISQLVSYQLLHFPFPKCLLFIYRRFSHRLFHCHDLLRNPHFLPRSRHWPVLGFGWHDFGGTTVPFAQGRWHRYHGFGLLFGHLLLRYHRLDGFLHGGHLQCCSGSPLGHVW